MSSLDNSAGDYLQKALPGGKSGSGMYIESVCGKMLISEIRSISTIRGDGSQDDLSDRINVLGLEFIKE